MVNLIFYCSLFGAYRYKNPLPWDTDIDFFLRAEELARNISSFAPLTIKATREGIKRLRDSQQLPIDKDLIEMCYQSNDFKEGMNAFFEKRKANFKGN